jgi:hypothetical protein
MFSIYDTNVVRWHYCAMPLASAHRPITWPSVIRSSHLANALKINQSSTNGFLEVLVRPACMRINPCLDN